MKMKNLWSYNIDVVPYYNTCLPNRQTPNQITTTTRFEAAAAEDSYQLLLPAASYDSNVWPYNLVNVGGGVVLDFESSIMRFPSAEEELRDFGESSAAGAGRRKRDCNVEPWLLEIEYQLCADLASQKRRKTVHTRQPTSVGS
ncbi:hypothetical protein Tco_1143718 [Tanacetum coccineum]